MQLSLKTILNICKEAKNRDQKIVFTNGCFDILHSGHCKYLHEAKKCGDLLIVGLNSDDSVRRLKGNSRPINDQNSRAFVLSALKSVDYVVLFEEDTPQKLIEQILPNVLVKGADYEPQNIVGADLVIKNGGTVVTIPLVAGKSTSNVIKTLAEIG